MDRGECAGWSKLHPNAGTRGFIIANDVSFAREVASHNAQGVKRKCWE